MSEEEVIEQSSTIVHVSHQEPLGFFEDTARKCYRSHDKITKDSRVKICEFLLKKGHTSIFEFVDVTVDIITDRSISHQIVRHRHCSFAQESQRYVRFNGNIQFIKPQGYDPTDPMWRLWLRSCRSAANDYCEMLAYGAKPQQARKVLPNSTATSIRVKANCREWMHIISLRDSPEADPDMKALMSGLHLQLAKEVPILFN